MQTAPSIITGKTSTREATPRQINISVVAMRSTFFDEVADWLADCVARQCDAPKEKNRALVVFAQAAFVAHVVHHLKVASETRLHHTQL